MPTASPRHARGLFSCQGSLLLSQLQQSSFFVPGNAAVAAGQEHSRSSPHSQQKLCTEEKQFPDMPVNAHDSFSLKRGAGAC